MNTNDRRQFADALTQLFAIYEKELTDRTLTTWWGVLAPYKLDAVLAAMNLHAGDIEFGMFAPRPAHIKRHLEVTIPKMMEERRAAIIADARERTAPLRERIAATANDVMLGIVTCHDAKPVVAECGMEIAKIMGEENVQLALAPNAALRDEAEIAPRDRLPATVRKVLGWLGAHRRG